MHRFITITARRQHVALLLAMGMSIGCSRPAVHEAGSSAGAAADRATVIQPERKTLIRIVELPGRAEARRADARSVFA